MLTLKATDARANFSKLIQDVQNEPIAIKKHGKCVAIVLTAEEYSKVQKLEDEYWAILAQKAHDEGYVGEEVGERLIEGFLNAKD